MEVFVNLCCNLINTLKKFQKLSSLLTFNLSYNYISKIDNDILERLGALTNLDISNNLILTIDSGAIN